MMNRRAFISMMSGSIVAAPLAAEAQQAGKVYRIGALSDGPNPASAPLADAMRELGWVAGQNLMVEQRNAEAREQLPAHRVSH